MEETRCALVLADDASATPIPLDQGRNTVGRSSANIISISDKSVSRHHAVLHVRGTEAMIEDLNSAGGTFVNEVQVQAFAKTPVRVGDMLTLGNCRCKVILVVVELEDKPTDEDGDSKTIISGL